MRTMEKVMKNKCLLIILLLSTLASCSSTSKKENDEVTNRPSVGNFNYFMGHHFNDRY